MTNRIVVRAAIVILMVAAFVFRNVNLFAYITMLCMLLLETVFDWKAERGIAGMAAFAFMVSVVSYTEFTKGNPASGWICAVCAAWWLLLIVGEYVKRAQARAKYPLADD